jgi:hypothetical protein
VQRQPIVLQLLAIHLLSQNTGSQPQQKTSHHMVTMIHVFLKFSDAYVTVFSGSNEMKPRTAKRWHHLKKALLHGSLAADSQVMHAPRPSKLKAF